MVWYPRFDIAIIDRSLDLAVSLFSDSRWKSKISWHSGEKIRDEKGNEAAICWQSIKEESWPKVHSGLSTRKIDSGIIGIWLFWSSWAIARAVAFLLLFAICTKRLYRERERERERIAISHYSIWASSAISGSTGAGLLMSVEDIYSLFRSLSHSLSRSQRSPQKPITNIIRHNAPV